MKRGFTLEIKVGLFVVVVLLLMAWISLRLGNVSLFEDDGYTLTATFDTAAGLDPESKVLLAGLRVGRLTSIAVVGGRARVEMRIRPGIEIPTDSRVKILAQGLLGQKYLDIKQGVSTEMMKDGDAFTVIEEPVGFDTLTDRAEPIIRDLTRITQSLATIIDSEAFRRNLTGTAANVESASGDLARVLAENQANLARIVASLEVITSTLAGNIARNEESLDRTLAALPQIAESLAIVSQRMADIAEGRGDDLDQTLAQLNVATERLAEAMGSVQSILAKVDEGEGTVGALVNERETLDDLSEAVDGLNDFLGRAKRTRLDVSYEAEYLFDADVAKHHLALSLWPRPNQYYMLGITAADGLGTTTNTTTTTDTTTNPGEANETRTREIEDKEVTRESVRIDAQIARRFWDITVRGGLIEGEGGVGLDYFVWDDRFRFTMEAFDFSNDDNPHLRGTASVRLLNNFIIKGGIDDFVHAGQEPDWFVGAGLVISDDDIKSLISILPVSSAF